MSLDYGLIGTVLSTAKLAWTTYKACKAAPGSFNNISAEVLSLHAVLRELEETLDGQELSSSRQERLVAVSSGCQSVLGDLQALVKKYESLGTKSKRTWDRLNWDAGEISELRARLTSNTVLLTAFMSSCQIVVERKLNQLQEDFQNGKHEGSVLSVATVESLAQDEKEIWRTIRKELEDMGISVEAFDANKVFIMNWFQQAMLDGAFEELGVDDVGSVASLNSTAEGHQPDQTPSLRNFGDEVQTATQSSQETSPFKPLQVQIPLVRPSSSQLPTPRDPKVVDSSALTIPPSTKGSYAITETHIEDKKSRIIQRTPRITLLFARLRGFNNRFIEAGLQSKFKEAEDLLQKGASIDARCTKSSSKHCKEGSSALVSAAQKTAMPVVQWLLDHGADINAKDSRGNAPLHGLIEHALKLSFATSPTRDMIEYLLSRGAEIDSHGMEGHTPLCIAAQNGLDEIIHLLLKNGAQCNTVCAKGDYPLINAIGVARLESVTILLDHGADCNIEWPDRESALVMAVFVGEPELVKLVLEHGAHPNDIFFKPLPNPKALLQYALEGAEREDGYKREKNIKIAKLLLEAGADPNYWVATKEGESRPLVGIAAGLKDTELFQLMVRKGVVLKVEDMRI